MGKSTVLIFSFFCLTAPFAAAAGSTPAPASAPAASAASAAPATASEPAPAPPKKDTVYLVRPPAAASAEATGSATRRRRLRYTDDEFDADVLERRRIHFEHVQNTGFGLLMGGIGMGTLGVFIMGGVFDRGGFNDDYNNFLGGYLVLAGGVALTTTGIIINRVAHHKKAVAERRLEELAAKVDLRIGPKSLALCYRF